MNPDHRELSVNTSAKVNLFLDVISKRSDGYHNIETIMQSVRLSDRLTFKKVDKPGYFKLICENARLPVNERNLVCAAYTALKQRFPELDGVFVGLEKNIPISAGLGGGSSDCAAALKAFRSMFSLPLDESELCGIAASLGADVPFFLNGGAALAKGIGEQLFPIKYIPYCYVVIVCPQIYISTASVFANYVISDEPRPSVSIILDHINNGNLQGICDNLYNALERVSLSLHPEIGEFKKTLLSLGAIGALMSGSGPSVFGIFDEKTTAVAAAEKIKTGNGQIRDIFVTTMGR